MEASVEDAERVQEQQQQQYRRNVLLTNGHATVRAKLAPFLRRPSLHEEKVEASGEPEGASSKKAYDISLPCVSPLKKGEAERDGDVHSGSGAEMTWIPSPFPGRRAVLLLRPVDRPCDDETNAKKSPAGKVEEGSRTDATASAHGVFVYPSALPCCTQPHPPCRFRWISAPFRSCGRGQEVPQVTLLREPHAPHTNVGVCVAAPPTPLREMEVSLHPTTPATGNTPYARGSMAVGSSCPSVCGTGKSSCWPSSSPFAGPVKAKRKYHWSDGVPVLVTVPSGSSATPPSFSYILDTACVPFTALLTTLAHHHFTPLSPRRALLETHWSVKWCKRPLASELERVSLQNGQKINHFPGSGEVGRKDGLHRLVQAACAFLQPYTRHRTGQGTTSPHSAREKTSQKESPTVDDPGREATRQEVESHWRTAGSEESAFHTATPLLSSTPRAMGTWRERGSGIKAETIGKELLDSVSDEKMWESGQRNGLGKGDFAPMTDEGRVREEEGILHALPQWDLYVPKGYLLPQGLPSLTDAVYRSYDHYHSFASPSQAARGSQKEEREKDWPSSSAMEAAARQTAERTSPSSSSTPASWFIVKPTNAACGNGIYIIDTIHTSLSSLSSSLQRLAATSSSAQHAPPRKGKGNGRLSHSLLSSSCGFVSSASSVDSFTINPFSSNATATAASSFIVQEYVERPFLVYGYKMDLRLYVVVTSYCPLRCYVYQEGLVRFATTPYYLEIPAPDDSEHDASSFIPSPPHGGSVSHGGKGHRTTSNRAHDAPSWLHRTPASQPTAHLTNFTINKKSEDYVVPRAAGNALGANPEKRSPHKPRTSGKRGSSPEDDTPNETETRREQGGGATGREHRDGKARREEDISSASIPLTSKWSLSALAAYIESQVAFHEGEGPATNAAEGERPVYYSWEKTWEAIKEALALVFLSVRPHVREALSILEAKQALKGKRKEKGISASHPPSTLKANPSPFLRVESGKPFMTYRGVAPYFEMYGVDVLLQHPSSEQCARQTSLSGSTAVGLHPVVLEVNIMPSLSTHYSPLDQTIKGNLLADCLTLVGLRGTDDARGQRPPPPTATLKPRHHTGVGPWSSPGASRSMSGVAAKGEGTRESSSSAGSTPLSSDGPTLPSGTSSSSTTALTEGTSLGFSLPDCAAEFLSFTTSLAAKEAVYTAEEELQRAPHFDRVFPPLCRTPGWVYSFDAAATPTLFWDSFLRSVPLRQQALFHLLRRPPSGTSRRCDEVSNEGHLPEEVRPGETSVTRGGQTRSVGPSSCSSGTARSLWYATSSEESTSVIPLELLLYAWEEWKQYRVHASWSSAS